MRTDTRLEAKQQQQGRRMKICFVGHRFHQRTQSSAFIVDLLRTIGDVTECYGDPDGAPAVNDTLVRQLAASRFDRYVYWQAELIAERLLPLNLGPSFIAPMYDTVADKADKYWLQFVDHHFLSFTRVHHERLRAIGCSSSHFQFFPDPGAEQLRWHDQTSRGFFWRRQPRSIVNYPVVLQQARALGLTHLHVHDAPDFAEDHNYPLNADQDGIGITISHWFERAADFEALAARPLFFFAPRSREGIGMACLEAMARGQIVVAPDLAATNEYVASGLSGLLYSPGEDPTATLSPLSADSLRRMSRAARRKVVEGRLTWLEDTDRLLSIVAMDGRRWGTSDMSAGFGRAMRRVAHARLTQ